MKPSTRTIMLTGLNAALYVTVGYMTFLGIFVGVVRFWPGVFIPAVFATLFGPIVGGVGAAIGIFISDMIIHGNALLSLTVGVPANFIMFYFIGYLTKYKLKKYRVLLFLAVATSLIVLGIALKLPWRSGEGQLSALLGLITIPIIILVGSLWPGWTKYQFAATFGNAIGSIIVGFGVWGYSQFFILPNSEGSLPIIAAYMLTVWTFMNQIPFLILLGPPILKACETALPGLSLR